MEVFFFRVVKYITFLVFAICFFGTTYNLFKCISKYIHINKKLNLYKNNNISSEDLNSLTDKEYYLWVYNFLFEFNYFDSKDFLFTTGVPVNIENSLLSTKNNLPVYIKIIRNHEGSRITLKNCHEFLGEMICKKCSLGILVYNDTFPEKCRTFLNTVPSNYKIIYLNNPDLIEFYNKISDFPTSLA